MRDFHFLCRPLSLKCSWLFVRNSDRSFFFFTALQSTAKRNYLKWEFCEIDRIEADVKWRSQSAIYQDRNVTAAGVTNNLIFCQSFGTFGSESKYSFRAKSWNISLIRYDIQYAVFAQIACWLTLHLQSHAPPIIVSKSDQWIIDKLFHGSTLLTEQYGRWLQQENAKFSAYTHPFA